MALLARFPKMMRLPFPRMAREKADWRTVAIRYFFRFTLKLVRIGLASVDYVEDILQFRERAGIFGIDGHLLPVEWMSVVMYTDRI